MPDVDKLTQTFTPEFRRERALLQEPAAGVQPSEVADQVERRMELKDNFGKVVAKAQGILKEASTLAITRSIPVPENALEVRAATVRQDPESQGLRISFDLYRKAYQYAQKQNDALPISILDDLSGDSVTDRGIVTRRLRELTDDISVEAAELLGDQITTLFILKLLQLGMDAMSDGAQSATKAPPALELPVIAAQIGISIAAQQLYAGLNEDKATAALEQLGTGIAVPPTDLDAARRSLAETPLFQAALLQRRPSDYTIIFEFVQAFLDRQTEPGWETWQMTPELTSSIVLAQQAEAQLAKYADQTSRTSRETLSDPMTALREAVSFDVQISNGAAVQPSRTMLDLYQRNLDSVNTKVDQMAYMLSDVLDVDDLCCMLKFFSEIGDRPVQLLRTVLDVQQNVLNMSSQFPAASANLNVTFSSILHQQAMMLLQDLNETVVRRIKEWMGTTPEKWQELFASCKLIDELMEFVLRSIEALEGLLLRYLDKWLGHIEDREARLNSKLNQAGQQKRLRFQMLTIDQFLEFGAEGGICPDTPAEPMQIAQGVERILSAVGPQIALPSLGGDPYETLTTPPLVLDTGVAMPATPGASAGQTPLDVAREVCRSNLVRQSVVEFPRG